MDRTLQGRRVKLLRCTDPYTRLTRGDMGTVLWADDMGTLHVDWDGGSSLGLVPGEDSWEIVDD